VVFSGTPTVWTQTAQRRNRPETIRNKKPPGGPGGGGRTGRAQTFAAHAAILAKAAATSAALAFRILGTL
jgi:hypothetical protein